MQSLGQLVLQRKASWTALWPEMYLADAHDAPLLPRQMHAITRAVGFCNAWRLGRPCGRKCTQLMLMMLPSCLVNACNHSGSWFCNARRLGRPCGRKCTQLMLMMLPSCLVKCMHSGSWFCNAWRLGRPCGRKCTQLVKCMQSLGQLVLQRLASRTALWPDMYPADAHDAPLLPRQKHAITRAVGFATLGV